MIAPVSYHISQADYLALMRLFAARALPHFALVMLGLASVMALLGVAAGQIEIGFIAAITLLVTVAVLTILSRLVLIPSRSGRTYREYGLIREEMTLTLSAEGFAIAQPSGSVAMAWGKVVAWDETGQIFAIHPTRQMAYILPKKAIGQERTDFIRQRLAEHGLPNRGKRRK